jgi:hypothetical protein
MTDYIVVRDDMSLEGLRRLHLLRAGKKLERQEVMERWGIDPEKVKAVAEYEDKETGMWHLRIYWKEMDNECVQAEETEISELKR